eukprot:TRINITY_DN29410_c0_g1_i1.p1 TRINITY_DN29410_c0_g1~~TRINITY_DN29410_c0_g1_i1.p1  ORF type:complete len:143 (-),score=30.04 TRINITY_DN29410_c0_g1_i1:101-484(-)
MAGLLDGAEEHLVWLVKANHSDALEPILNLYSQTREWEKGINMLEAHSDLFSKPQHFKAIANFYCEAALLNNDPQIMRKAISLNHKAIRPLYELGKSAFDKRRLRKSKFIIGVELICSFTFFCFPCL